MKGKIYVLLLIFFGVLLLVKPSTKVSFAQVTIGVTGSPAPVSVIKLNDCISAGKDIFTCAQEVVAYLHSLNFDANKDRDCSATSYSCTITCGNGTTIVISKPTPTPTIAPCPGVCKPADAQGKACKDAAGKDSTYDYKDTGDEYCKKVINNSIDNWCMVCKPAPSASPSPSPSPSDTPTISPTTSPPASTPTVGTPPPPVSTPTTSTTPPGGTPTLPPATATPKPPFNEEACQCVGLDVTSLSPGAPFTATAKGKVVGSDMDKAKLISFKFFLYKGTDTSSSMLPISEIPTSVIVDTAGGVANYTATWNATFPTVVDPNITYRIQAQKKCVPKSIGMASSNKVVLGTKTESQGLFEIFFAFINRILGRKEKVVQNVPLPTATPQPASVQTLPKGDASVESNNSGLHYGTFYPGEIIDQSCSFIKFKFASKN